VINIGSRLKDLRETAGLSQGDIQKRSGLIRCYLSRVEHGHTVPTLATLEKYAQALGLETYQLLYEGNRPVAPKVSRYTPKQDPLAGLNSRDRRLVYAMVRRLRGAEGKARRRSG
jgi:transcriptional regulator with XRE-family HTH domain